MTYKAEWFIADEVSPPKNTFEPLWLYGDGGIGLGRWVEKYATDPPIMGWETGVVHEKITHWAYMVRPEPPGVQR